MVLPWSTRFAVQGLLGAIVAVLSVVGPVAAAERTPFYFDMVAVPGAEAWVAKYEVTQAQYLEVTGENPSQFQDPGRPVETVTWDDAVTFCEKLTARETAARRLPAGFIYDLPTDAQWDVFASGTDLKDAATSLDKPRTSTEIVGAHPANPLGLHDIVGNVWEWCRDWYDNSIRKKDSNKDMPYIPSDAEAAASGADAVYKVLRGGAWDTTTADGFTLASRLRYAPGMSNYHTGFRCVVVRKSDDQPAASKRNPN